MYFKNKIQNDSVSANHEPVEWVAEGTTIEPILVDLSTLYSTFHKTFA